MKRIVSTIAAVVSCSAILGAQGTAPTLPHSRTVFVTVTDRDGLPVEDLTPAEFEIKEGGKAVIIAEAGIAREPLEIALIVDDNALAA